MRFTVLSFCLMLVVLGGCGIKPRNLDPPAGAKKNTFPRTYPDPATDPKPEAAPPS